MSNFKEDLVRVKAFVFDIDGVLSLQTIILSSFGIPNRTVNLRDGYAHSAGCKKGLSRCCYIRWSIQRNTEKDYIYWVLRMYI